MPVNLGAAATFKQVAATPGTPPASHQSLYIKSDGTVATENSSGVEQTMLDGTDWMKVACRAATTVNLTLSAPQTVDGVSLVAGDRVLVKNQSTTAQNGIYVVAAGSWVRSSDTNTSALMASAATTVAEGSSNTGRTYQNKFKATDTLGTTGIDWWYLVDNLAGSILYVAQNSTQQALSSPVKDWVKAAAVSNNVLNSAQTVDSISCVAGDRVLCKAQATPSQNGIYIVQAGAWTRATDADTSAKVAGASVTVLSGTVNGGSTWSTSFKSTDTIGTTAMPWLPQELIGTYVPTWSAATTPPTLSNGTTTGSYTLQGSLCYFSIITISGSTTAYGTGQYSWPLPFNTIRDCYVQGEVQTGGIGNLIPFAAIVAAGTATIPPKVWSTTAGGANTNMTQAAPVAWTTGTKWVINGSFFWA